MALRELAPQREKCIQEVNGFLDNTWGIKSYEELAPVVLVQRNRAARTRKGVAYPIIIDDSKIALSRSERTWTGLAAGEDTSCAIRFAKLKSGEIRMLPGYIERKGRGYIKGKGWELTNTYEGNDIKTEGYLPRKTLSSETILGFIKNVVNYSPSQSMPLPLAVHYMGELGDDCTHERREIRLLDFSSSGSLKESEKLEVARWLMNSISCGDFEAGNQKPVPLEL